MFIGHFASVRRKKKKKKLSVSMRNRTPNVRITRYDALSVRHRESMMNYDILRSKCDTSYIRLREAIQKTSYVRTEQDRDKFNRHLSYVKGLFIMVLVKKVQLQKPVLLSIWMRHLLREKREKVNIACKGLFVTSVAQTRIKFYLSVAYLGEKHGGEKHGGLCPPQPILGKR